MSHFGLSIATKIGNFVTEYYNFLSLAKPIISHCWSDYLNSQNRKAELAWKNRFEIILQSQIQITKNNS